MIPKIIHQIWIGPKEPPTKLMDTWKEKHPDFEYIRWNEEEFIKRDMQLECQDKIDGMEQICGKADIIRLELLYKYGGVFLDADSICIEPIDYLLYNNNNFLIYENEKVRKGLIANGIMGFIPNHPFIKKCIEFIKNNEVSYVNTRLLPWQITGPTLVTYIYNTNKYKDINILPSYFFLPIHHTGQEYRGHGKIYSHQLWGSTNFNKFDKSGNLPVQLLSNNESISLLIENQDEKIFNIQNCLNSIKNQIGNFNIELIWINNSDQLNTKIIKNKLDIFKKTTRFIDIKYYEQKEYDLYNNTIQKIKSNEILDPECLLYTRNLC
jgi:mannosyltransferase OCH1-like enzyme